MGDDEGSMSGSRVSRRKSPPSLTSMASRELDAVAGEGCSRLHGAIRRRDEGLASASPPPRPERDKRLRLEKRKRSASRGSSSCHTCQDGRPAPAGRGHGPGFGRPACLTVSTGLCMEAMQGEGAGRPGRAGRTEQEPNIEYRPKIGVGQTSIPRLVPPRRGVGSRVRGPP